MLVFKKNIGQSWSRPAGYVATPSMGKSRQHCCGVPSQFVTISWGQSQKEVILFLVMIGNIVCQLLWFLQNLQPTKHIWSYASACQGCFQMYHTSSRSWCVDVLGQPLPNSRYITSKYSSSMTASQKFKSSFDISWEEKLEGTNNMDFD